MKSIWIICCLLPAMQENEPVTQKQDLLRSGPIVIPFSKPIQDTPPLAPPVVSKAVSQEKPAQSLKALPVRPVKLENESLDDIRKIRDRIGIKLFDDAKSNEDFARQLRKLSDLPPQNVKPVQVPRIQRPNPSVVHPERYGPVNPGTISPARIQNKPVQWNQPIRSYAPKYGLPPKNGMPRPNHGESKQTATIQSLISACENLDRFALELELNGEAEKSKKMRKLGRSIRKQLLQLTNSRDN